MDDDLISRQAAIKAVDDLPNCYNGYSDAYDKAYIIEVLEELPSAQPERKRGKWIDETFKPWGLVYHPYKCNQCGEHSEAGSDFCPNCGADMREE